MGSSLLQTFWDLSSYEEGERIKAAKELLHLLEEQHRVSTVSIEVCELRMLPPGQWCEYRIGVCGTEISERVGF